MDETEYASRSRSFKFEGGDPGTAYAVKRISFPPRVPFAVNEDNFTIANSANSQRNALADRDYGTSREGRKFGKENPVSSGSGTGRASSGRDASSGQIRQNRRNSNGTTSGTKNTVKSFSVSPAGGSYYIYSFDGKLLAEYNTSGVCVRDYIYMGNQLIAEYDPASSQYYYYTSDQINSTRIVTDGTGAVVYAAAHDPYGGIQKTWVSTFDPVPKFSGKEHDGESQLDYFGARYYDRSQYRFISTDPDIFGEIVAGDVREMNHYAYSGNNPLGFMDIDGLKFISVQDAQQIVRIAALWASANTLYDGSKGRSSARGISGDCCGTTWGIYKEAGYEYEFKPANEEFTKSLREGGENHDKLQVAPGNIPQVGDIGYYNGHMCIYAGVDTDGKEWIWTTSSTKGKYVKMELWRFLYNTKNEFEWFRWYIPDSPPAEPVSKI